MNNSNFSVKRDGTVLWKKFPIGCINKNTLQVTDVRGKVADYDTLLQCLQHFTTFIGWREYVNCRPKPINRVVYNDTEVYPRWSRV